MSTLAFNKEGEPFAFDPRTEQLRLRRFRKPGARGTCEVVLGADGEQVYVDADADYAEVRDAADNVPGFYRLDQCDENGQPIPGLPAAYVSIEVGRHTRSSGDGDAMGVVRELAAINAEVSKTMADRFAAVMQSTAEILRAADGAGIAHRNPLVLSARVVDSDDSDDDDHDDEPDVPPGNPMINALASISTIVQVVQPMVEQLKSIYMDMKANAAQGVSQGTSPAAATASGPEPASAPPTEGAPAAATVQDGGAAGGSGPGNAFASATDVITARAEVSAATPSPATAASAPTAKDSTASGSMANTAPTTSVVPVPTHAAAVTPTLTVRNAVVPNAQLAPTSQQLAHLMMICARLSPKEQVIAEQVIARMTNEVRARWLVDLSRQSVDDAVKTIRNTLATVQLDHRVARRERDGR